MGHEIIFISTGRTFALMALTIALSLSASSPAEAQNTTSAAARAPSRSGAQSGWSTLTAAQQQALAPLAADWDSLDSAHKKKWLVIANKFPAMKPEERSRVQNRMREWAELSPQQRQIARENYWRTKKIESIQKSAHWQQYQQLPDELKKSLAAAGASNKRVANLSKAPKKNDAWHANSKKNPPQRTQAHDKDSSTLAPSVPSNTK